MSSPHEGDQPGRRFALIGAAGYIAPRHLQAIKATGGDLLAALDPSDSVGIIDSYFPDAHFFTEFERFDRHVDKCRRSEGANSIEFVSICSPNYLHDSHMRFALRSGANAICEKPLVLNPWNLDGLLEMEESTGGSINTILQLRLHPTIIALRDRLVASERSGKSEVELTYVTSRGRWYLQSWKGNDDKSGGIATNIGVHFFDMLHFLFGKLQESRVHLRTEIAASGLLEYEHARVRWYLSLDLEDVPEAARSEGLRTYRSISVDGEEVEFSGGFTDLHTRSYEEILAGRGFGVEANRSAIEAVSGIRAARVVRADQDIHPFARRR